jgi:cytochrome c556
MRAKQIFATILAAAAIGVSGMAFAQATRTPAEMVDYRHQQFRRIGASFKAVNDGLRAGSPDVAALRTQTAALAQSAVELPTWFPAGSGAVGTRNRAKAEIWSDSAGWQQRVTQFQNSTRTLAAAADVAAMRGAVRAVGASCASCHSAFRVPD